MASINIKKNGQWTGNPVLGFKVGEENLTDELKEKIANGAEGSGGISKTVLWINASPSSSFSGQDIYLSTLYEYDGIEVAFKVQPYGPGDVASTGMIPVDVSDFLLMYVDIYGVTSNSTTTADFSAYTRRCYFTSQGVQFAESNNYSIKYGGGLESAYYCVPLVIYGIKGVT